VTRGGRSRTGRLLGGIVAAFLAITAAGMASAAAEKVTIATGQDFLPFEFVDADGKPAGLVIDLWRLWSEKTGIAVEFVPAPWAQTLDMVRDGRADIHAGLNNTEERQKFLDYGDSLLSTNSYVFSPAGIELSGAVSDLVGFRIGVLKGSLEESLLRQRVPGAEVVPFDGIGDLYDAIAADKIRLFADVEQTGLYFLGQRGLVPKFRYDAAQPLDANYLFAAVTKGKKDLLEKVNEGLRRITANERSRITRRWLAPVEGRTADTLVIAISRNYPPFTLIDANGQAAGMLVDMWRLWAEKTGRRITFRQSSWADTLYALRNGEADIHSGLFYSAERAEWMGFSRPAYEISSSIYHRTGEAPPTVLAGKKIGAGFGYYQESFLRKNHPDANVVTFGDDEELIRGLSKGEVDAFLSEDPTVEAMLDRMGMRGRITSSGRPLLRNELYFGVRKDDVDLLAEIESGLDAIEAEELAAIERRWVTNPEKRFLSVGPVSLSAGERGWIADNATLKIGTVPQGETLIRVEAGEPKGYAVDFLKRVADKVGLGFEFIPHSSWDDVMAAYRAGDIDIVPLAVKTPEQ
jgi:ABC-type amino acid transport substrate-binding protein